MARCPGSAKVRATVASAIQDLRANGCHDGVVTPDRSVSGQKACYRGQSQTRNMQGSRAADGRFIDLDMYHGCDGHWNRHAARRHSWSWTGADAGNREWHFAFDRRHYTWCTRERLAERTLRTLQRIRPTGASLRCSAAAKVQQGVAEAVWGQRERDRRRCSASFGVQGIQSWHATDSVAHQVLHCLPDGRQVVHMLAKT